MTTASPLATRVAWLPVSVIVPLAKPEHRADNTRTTAAALPAEATRRVTAAGLLKCGRLTFHCRRQLMPFRGSAGVPAGCASAAVHLLTLAVPRSYPLVSEMNPATPRTALL